MVSIHGTDYENEIENNTFNSITKIVTSNIYIIEYKCNLSVKPNLFMFNVYLTKTTDFDTHVTYFIRILKSLMMKSFYAV